MPSSLKIWGEKKKKRKTTQQCLPWQHNLSTAAHFCKGDCCHRSENMSLLLLYFQKMGQLKVATLMGFIRPLDLPSATLVSSQYKIGLLVFKHLTLTGMVADVLVNNTVQTHDFWNRIHKPLKLIQKTDSQTVLSSSFSLDGLQRRTHDTHLSTHPQIPQAKHWNVKPDNLYLPPITDTFSLYKTCTCIVPHLCNNMYADKSTCFVKCSTNW